MKWQSYKLKEVGEVVTGNTPPTTQREYYGTQYKFIKPTDMREGQRYVPITEEYYSELAYQKYRKSLLPVNTPCVVTIGSLGKKMCLTDEPSFTNQAVNAVIPNENFDGEFLYYCLRTRLPYVKQLDSGTTSGRENVSKSSFSNIVIEAPSLAIQKRIASILSAYDNLIENNNKRIKILEQMAENLYKEWFVRFRFPGHETTPLENGIPKGWSIAPFSQNADVMSGGTPSTDNPNYYDGCIPFFTPKDCDDSFFVFETITNITEDGLNHCNSQLYPENTIAITARGTVGNVALFACPMAMNQSCFALKSDKLNNQYYLFFAIKNEVLKLKKMANGGVFDTIVVKSFDHIPLTIPSEDVLKKFERLITPIMKMIREIQVSSNNLIKQRDLLLPRLMSGKLAV